MNTENKQPGEKEKEKRFVVSEVLSSGEIVELVYREKYKQTGFVVYDGTTAKYVEKIELPHEVLIPVPGRNHLISKKVVLFPFDVEEYGDETQLLTSIRRFVHKYLAVSERFEKIASYYVLFSWVYDRFNELAYLRARGDFGSGKSRFLRVIGSICYKPMFTGGATSTSPIFRIIDGFRGTLIVDEADFRFSDTTADVVKILNSGFQTGTPVLRSEGKGTFEVKSFDVFGPKIVATRGTYADLALESRFLTEEMGKNELRDDIPENVPPEFDSEALKLRNQLLLWRFRNLKTVSLKPIDPSLAGVEPRLRQIINPLLSIVDDPEVKDEIISTVKEYNRELMVDKGLSLYAEVFETLLKFYETDPIPLTDPTVKDIAESFNLVRPQNERISVGRMGNILRKHLGLQPRRINVGWTVSLLENKEQIRNLRKKFGIPEPDMNGVNHVNIWKDPKKNTSPEARF